MKFLHVVGARPQFIKAFVVSRAIRCAHQQEVLLHTGQHYDYQMSKVFFEEIDLPEPDFNLGVGSGSHGAQTGAMLTGIEQVLSEVRPAVVLVYGDTNSTLAGALAAVKLHLPVAHVEAGLRSFRRDMPEEVNRIVTDHIADFLFAPTATAVANLGREDLENGVHLVGDVMLEAAQLMLPVAKLRSTVLEKHQLARGGYGLATLHRAANTDDPRRLRSVIEALGRLDRPVVFPVHPRTRAALETNGLTGAASNLRMIEPVGYLDMLVLEESAHRVLTDSGGVQKEAYFLGVPCITLREETEWMETVEAGWNVLAGVDAAAIRQAWERPDPPGSPPLVFGDGAAAQRIVSILSDPAAVTGGQAVGR